MMSTLEVLRGEVSGIRRSRLDQALAAASDFLSVEEVQSLLQQTVDGAVEELRRRRNRLPDSRDQEGAAHCTQLDIALLPLLRERGSLRNRCWKVARLRAAV